MPPTLVLVRDLMFSSKISATARSAGIAIEMVRDASILANKDGTRLIVDLNQPDALDAAVSWKAVKESREVIGFVSHVDADTIARARSAGIDRIMPRSQFASSLEALLRG